MKRKFKYNLSVPIELLRPHEKTTNEHVSYWNKMYIEKSFIPAVAVSEENIIIDCHRLYLKCGRNRWGFSEEFPKSDVHVRLMALAGGLDLQA